MSNTSLAAGHHPDRAAEKTALAVLIAISFCHMLNDTMQSLLLSIYPMLKANYALDFGQVGLITLTFQVTASLLQPMIGLYTDRKPKPYALAIGMSSTFFGLLLLSYATSYAMLLVVTGPIMRTLCRTPNGIHTPCAGGTTQAPCSVHTIMTPRAP